MIVLRRGAAASQSLTMYLSLQRSKRFNVRSVHTPQHKSVHSFAANAVTRRAYDFLSPAFCSEIALDRSIERASRLNVRPHDVLLAEGIISADHYVEALAQHFGLPFLPPGQVPSPTASLIDGTAIDPVLWSPVTTSNGGYDVTLTTPEALHHLEAGHIQHRRLHQSRKTLLSQQVHQ